MKKSPFRVREDSSSFTLGMPLSPSNVARSAG